MEEKDLNLGIEGVSAQIRNNTLIVTSRRRMNTLSSAVLNGGFVEAKSIVNHQVPRNWENHKPDKYLQKLGTSLKLPEPIVGMMTSVDIRHLSASVETTPVRIVALVSAGVRHSVAAGEEMTIKATGAGTINIILLIDGNLTPSAM
ncbi:MAG: adenosylcobinamide amidohydrolase, partial [Nitrososphaerales archaeon]